MWVRGLGIDGPERVGRAQALDGDEVRGFLMTSQSGYGGMSHLRPAVRMSQTQPRWKRPVARLGTHPAAWPEPEGRLARAG
jgi:hypothetical protein